MISARGEGPVNELTRQPANFGRQKGVALSSIRLGHMEKDALGSHGASQVLVERMFISCDFFIARVCMRCGLIAKNTACCDGALIEDVRMPYILKLIIQNLMAMCLVARIKVKTVQNQYGKTVKVATHVVDESTGETHCA
jgi:DNA-directed RNA polymerase beta subunit